MESGLLILKTNIGGVIISQQVKTSISLKILKLISGIPETITLPAGLQWVAAGWIKGDKEILLYDEYNVWAVKPDGTGARKLTEGEKDETMYRVIPYLILKTLFLMTQSLFSSAHMATSQKNLATINMKKANWKNLFLKMR